MKPEVFPKAQDPKPEARCFFSLLFFVFIFTAAAAKPAAAARVQAPDYQQLLKDASLVLYGEVVQVVDTEAGQARKTNRPMMLATVRPIRVYKGAVAEQRITVSFLGARQREMPPRTALLTGERAILFLVRYETSPAYEFVNPYQGKALYDSALDKLLDTTATQKNLKPGISAELQVSPASAPPGGPVWVTVTIRNDSAAPVTIGAAMEPSRTLTVTGPDGKPVPAAAAAPPEVVRRADFVTLASGRFFGFRADIARIFKLTAPGAYSITFAYASPGGTAHNLESYPGAVQSNAAAFTIAK